MAASLPASCSRSGFQVCPRRSAVSLVELLVVLFIIGIMLSLLLPALSGARSKANDTMCHNHLRQVHMALDQSIRTTRKFPDPNRWTVAILRWIEEEPLNQALKDNYDPNAELPRPAFLRCPFQEEFPSRVPSVGFCHYVLVVDRPIRVRPEKVKWELHDRQLLSQGIQQPPWFMGPELSFVRRARLFANRPGPHAEGKYMTSRGDLVP